MVLSIQVGFWSLYDFILFLLPFRYLLTMSIKWLWDKQFQIDVSVDVSLFHLLCVYNKALEPFAIRQSHYSFYLLVFRSTSSPCPLLGVLPLDWYVRGMLVLRASVFILPSRIYTLGCLPVIILGKRVIGEWWFRHDLGSLDEAIMTSPILRL
jgi:hypothetical protein